MNHITLWTLGSYLGWYHPTQSPQRRERKIVTPNYNRSHTHNSTTIVLILILTELKQLSSHKEGVPVEIPGEGVNLHFQLCMIIGDTKGHDKMCCHYNNHSRNICRMVCDCDRIHSVTRIPMTHTTTKWHYNRKKLSENHFPWWMVCYASWWQARTLLFPSSMLWTLTNSKSPLLLLVTT